LAAHDFVTVSLRGGWLARSARLEQALLGRRPVGLMGVIAAAATLAASGCGGGGSSSQTTTVTTVGAVSTTTTSAGLTHAAFVAKLDDICKRGNAPVAGLEEQANKLGANDYAKYAALLEKRQRLAAPFNAEIAKLTAPPADAAAFARYKEMSNRLDGLLVRLIAALKAKDLTEANRPRSSSRDSVDARRGRPNEVLRRPRGSPGVCFTPST
jgi:hypothetical protein